MLITDLLFEKDYHKVFDLLIDKRLLEREFLSHHYPTAYCLEKDMIAHSGEKRAGYYNRDKFKRAVSFCFLSNLEDIKQDAMHASGNRKLVYTTNTKYLFQQREMIGPAGIKRNQTIDVYGLYDVELEFTISGSKIKHTGVRADWGSVDYRVIQSDSIKDIARQMLESVQDKADEKGIATNVKDNIEIEK